MLDEQKQQEQLSKLIKSVDELTMLRIQEAQKKDIQGKTRRILSYELHGETRTYTIEKLEIKAEDRGWENKTGYVTGIEIQYDNKIVYRSNHGTPTVYKPGKWEQIFDLTAKQVAWLEGKQTELAVLRNRELILSQRLHRLREKEKELEKFGY